MLRALGRVAKLTKAMDPTDLRRAMEALPAPQKPGLSSRILDMSSPQALPGDNAYDDLYSLVDDTPGPPPSGTWNEFGSNEPASFLTRDIGRSADEITTAAPPSSRFSSEPAKITKASGPRGLADPRLGKIPDMEFTTRMVDDELQTIAHGRGVNLPDDIYSTNEGKGIYGYMKGPINTRGDAYVDMTEVAEQTRGVGIGGALLEEWGIQAQGRGAKAIVGDIHGPEALTNRVRVFGEGATSRIADDMATEGVAVHYGDIITQDVKGSLGSYRTELPDRAAKTFAQRQAQSAARRPSSARRAAGALTPDKTIGTGGSSSARQGLPRRGGG